MLICNFLFSCNHTKRKNATLQRVSIIANQSIFVCMAHFICQKITIHAIIFVAIKNMYVIIIFVGIVLSSIVVFNHWTYLLIRWKKILYVKSEISLYMKLILWIHLLIVLKLTWVTCVLFYFNHTDSWETHVYHLTSKLCEWQEILQVVIYIVYTKVVVKAIN